MLYFFSFALCEFYYIRQYKSNKFVSKGDANLVAPTLVTFEDAGAFECKKSNSNYRLMEIKLLDSSNDLVWDMAAGGNKLIFYGYHGLKNQQFSLIPINCSGVFAISYNDKCLAYNQEYADFELAACSEDDITQQFEFLDVEKFSGANNGYGEGGSGGGSSEGGSGSGGGGSGGGGSGGSSSGDGSEGGSGGSGTSPLMATMYELMKDMHSVIFGTASQFSGYGYRGGQFLARIKGMPLNPARLAAMQNNMSTVLAELTTICHLI